MNSSPPTQGLLADRFKRSYLRSLTNYRFFYDDVAEIGNPDRAEHVFYFVPGINGTPGQMRFMLPSLNRVFGSRVYLKALHLPEFSAHTPIWEKYSIANVERKLAQLRADLAALLARFDRISVLCSSNGLYDFLAAAGSLDAADLERRVQLAWGACAPDHFGPTPWEKVLYPLNGFTHRGHRWFAFPNHNCFKVLNPETSTSLSWRDGHARELLKVDLESRFDCCGLEWGYTSTTQLDATTRHVVSQIRRPWGAPAEALVAAQDGYWQGQPPREVEAVIRRYLPAAHCAFKPSSHLWVVNPTHVTGMFERMQPHLAPRLSPARARQPGVLVPA